MVYGSWYKVQGSGLVFTKVAVSGLGFGVWGVEFGGWGLGSGVLGLGFEVGGLEPFNVEARLGSDCMGELLHRRSKVQPVQPCAHGDG